MSERKVLNKYYPPDFDPSKIPRMKLPKNRQYTVRLMAPFNMRCAACGEYIYKGKKFNARKEDVENDDYLGVRIYRFYIKCTRCLQEISFKTDPKNTDYEIEAGATRNFMALKLAEELAQKEEDEIKEEQANNPMKLLENRTEQSKNEIELLESLEELKDLNKRQESINFDSLLEQYDDRISQAEREEKIKQIDDNFIKSIKFANKRKFIVEEEIIYDDVDKILNETNSNSIEKSNEKLINLQSSNSVNNNSKLVKNETKKNISKKLGLVKLKTKSDLENKHEITINNEDKIINANSTKNSNDNKDNFSSALSMLGSYDSDSNESS